MPKRCVLIAIFALGLTTTNFGQTKDEPVGERTAVIISKIDDSVVNEFQKAWFLSGSGLEKAEALVLLYQMPAGSTTARLFGSSGVSRPAPFRKGGYSTYPLKGRTGTTHFTQSAERLCAAPLDSNQNKMPGEALIMQSKSGMR